MSGPHTYASSRGDANNGTPSFCRSLASLATFDCMRYTVLACGVLVADLLSSSPLTI